jgi:hypothetical protein
MMMPRQGGLKTYLKMIEIRPEAKAVFVSGWYGQEEQRFATEHDLPIVHKPFSGDQLLRAVREALDR